MLWRLFSKTKAIPDRSQYRSAPSRADGVGVQIALGNGVPISGRLVNMSAGGAAIEFDEGVEGDLVLGAVRTITFSSLTSKPLRVAAAVRSLPTRTKVCDQCACCALAPQVMGRGRVVKHASVAAER